MASDRDAAHCDSQEVVDESEIGKLPTIILEARRQINVEKKRSTRSYEAFVALSTSC
jgi:hypothetical protein